MPSTQYKIAETFHSVQGEGSWAGQQAFFIRFHGCNLECDFGNGFKCDDAAHSGPDYEMLNLLELEIKARKIPTTLNVVLTGGEISLNGSIGKVIRTLKSFGFQVACETNGFQIERLRDADLITYSPKTKWAHKARLVTHEEYAEMENGEMPQIELKLLAGTQDTPDKIWESYPMKYVQAIGFEHGFDEANMNACIAWVIANPDWYLSTQLQKLYGVR